MLHVKNISYHVAGRSIFEGASATVPSGQKVGLVGGNGSGKTTLLRLVTDVLELDGGSIDIRKKCKVGSISQETPDGDKSPIDTVLDSDDERRELLIESEESSSPKRIAYIHERLIDIDAHAAPSRAASILAGLGFDEQMQAKPLNTFSGGWKMRVALACALFSNADLLLLDEPTNHLDLESVIWLKDYLNQFKNTLIVVSHDRDLLNGVVNNILYVKDGKIAHFSGNYDACVKAMAEKEALDDSTRAKQEARAEHLQSFVDRFRAKANKAKQAQSRLKMLEKMTPLQSVSKTASYKFRFDTPLTMPSPLVRMVDAEVGYVPDVPVLKDVSLSIYKNDKIALLGANGNGKSTLIKLMSGVLKPQSGQVVTAGKLLVGYFAQDHLEQLDPNITALQQMSNAMPDKGQKDVRSYLGRFGFQEQRADVLVGNLSGGEKTRLALSLTALPKPNLLLLDEPTNHLDMDSRAALVEGINNFEGAVILISHDRVLIESSCEQLWCVDNKTCSQYFGDMNDYQKLLLTNRKGINNKEADGDDQDKTSKKDQRRVAAEQRALIAPLKKSVDEAEKNLEQYTNEKDSVEQQLSDPKIYEGPGDEIARLTEKMKTLTQQIEQTEELWLESHEAYELAKSQSEN